MTRKCLARIISASLVALASATAVALIAYRASRTGAAILARIERSVPAAASLLRGSGNGFVLTGSGVATARPSGPNVKPSGHMVRAMAPERASLPFRVGSLSGGAECDLALTRAGKSARQLSRGVAIYPDTYDSVDVVAVHEPERFEVLYYVRDLAHPPALAFSLNPRFDGASLAVEPTSGDVLVRGKDGRASLRVGHPVLVDSVGTRRPGRYELDGHELRLALSWDGLVPPVVVDPSITIPFWTLSSDGRSPGNVTYDPRTLSTEGQTAVDSARGRLVLVRPVRSRQPDDRNFLAGEPVQERDLQFVGQNPRQPQHGVVLTANESLDWARTIAGTETWEWDGSSWHLAPAATLPARIDPALAFSSALGKTILFGGAPTSDFVCYSDAVGSHCRFDSVTNFAYGPLGATYEYDGAHWVERRISGGPPPRTRASMAAFREGVLLFGGRGLNTDSVSNGTVLASGQTFPDFMGTSLLNDTWTFDGATWRRIETAHPPTPVESAQLVYDEHRKVVVLVGGLNVSGTEVPSIWEFDGTDWTERMPAAGVPAELVGRTGFAAFWDAVTERVMLFGGSATVFASCPYSGADLQNRVGAARSNPALNDQLAALGCLGGYKHDLWRWDGVQLTQLTQTDFGGYKNGKPVFRQLAVVAGGPPPTTAPPPPPPAAAVDAPSLQTPQWPWRHDRRRAHFELRSLLERAYVGDAPASSSSASSPPPAPPPPPTGGGTGGAGTPPAFVSPLFLATSRPKVFPLSTGHFQTITPNDHEVFETDGAVWQLRTPGQSPFATGSNDFFAATWDSAAHRILLFDPRSGNSWTYQDGTGWSALSTTASSPGLWNVAPTVLRARDLAATSDAQATLVKVPQMTFDRNRGRAVMLYAGALWEFDGAHWTSPAALPPGWDSCTAGTSLAYDGQRHVAVAFGCVVPGETWEWNGTAWRGPLPGPFRAVIRREGPFGDAGGLGQLGSILAADERLHRWNGTAQLPWAHPNAATEIASMGGIATMDADGTLRIWNGVAWKDGAKLADGYYCNAASIVRFPSFKFPDLTTLSYDPQVLGGYGSIPTCFFPPLVEDSNGQRLLAFRDGSRGLLELDLTSQSAAWGHVHVGTEGGTGLGTFVSDAVYPHPYELWGADHVIESLKADPATRLFPDGTLPNGTTDAYRLVDWYTHNLFWPFRLLRDPDTGRVRVLTDRGAVWELGGEHVSKLGEPCQTGDDCGQGVCTVEKVCCDMPSCGSTPCTTCTGAQPGHCGPVPAHQSEPRGLCGSGECQAVCSGNAGDLHPCVYDSSKACGPSVSCSDAVLTPGGHCSPTRASCLPPSGALPPCPVVDGRPVLTTECRVAPAPCPAGLICADATSCKPAPEQTSGGCTTAADCSAGLGCNPTTHTCIAGGCVTVADCVPGAKYCDPGTHTCTVGGCMTATDCDPGFTCDSTTHTCIGNGCITAADCAPGYRRCNPATHACVQDGCTTRADCTNRFDACNVASGLCSPDHSSVLAGQLGIVASTFQPPPRKTPEELAEFFHSAGLPRVDGGAIVVPGVTLGGYEVAFDPKLHTPAQGLAACLERIQVCLSALNPDPSADVDSCVAGLPRCATETPWDGDDPAGEDCCPETCIESYLSARQNGPANVARIFTSFGCYPGVPVRGAIP